MTEPTDSQDYYWTPEWQADEQASLAEYTAGRARRFSTADDAIAWLLNDPTPGDDR